MNDTELTTEAAPLPWRIEEPNRQYFSIVDAAGNRICDFFPFAVRGGRGRTTTLFIAQKIIDMANAGLFTLMKEIQNAD